MNFVVYCDTPPSNNWWNLSRYRVVMDGKELFSSLGILGLRRDMREWISADIISMNQQIQFSENCGNTNKYTVPASVFLLPIREYRDTLGL